MIRSATCRWLLLFLVFPAAAGGTAHSVLRAEGGATFVHQRLPEEDAQDSGASADLFVYLPTTSGEWTLYVEANSSTDEDGLFNLYPEINADAGSAQDADGSARIQLSELHYRWDIGHNQQFTFGQIDPSAQLDRSRIANDENNHFLATGFVNNPTIEFPDYTLGFLYRRRALEDSPEVTFMLTSSDGLADNPGRSYQELVDLGEAGKGVFAGLGTRWYLGDHRVGVGAWYRSDDHPTFDNPDSGTGNHGFYALYGWQSGSHGVSLRAGWARPSVSRTAGYLGVSYEGLTPFGAFGLGVGQIFQSGHADQADTGDTTQIETFFRIPLGSDRIHLTPALQYLKNSGFDSSDDAVEAEALIVALRLHVWAGG
ncbi:MAG: hypothetical protein R3E82_19965 [Pseudomonadales bacterium]